MKKTLILLFTLTNFLFANIYFIDNESKLINVINNFKDFSEDLNKEEHTFIIDKINLKSQLNNFNEYKTFKINIIDKKGTLLQITDLYIFIEDLNTILERKESELVVKKSNIFNPNENLLSVSNKKNNDKKEITKTEIIKTLDKQKEKQNEQKDKIQSNYVSQTSIKEPKKQTSQEELNQILSKIIEENKNYVSDNSDNNNNVEEKQDNKITKKDNESIKTEVKEIVKQDNKTDIIETTINKLKQEKVQTIKNPFKESSTVLYKFNNTGYSKKELLEKMEKNEIVVNENNMSELFLTLRTMQDDKDIYNSIKTYYLTKVVGAINQETQIYALNTLLLFRKEIELEKDLGKILLRNQKSIQQEELRISYKLLGIYQ